MATVTCPYQQCNQTIYDLNDLNLHISLTHRVNGRFLCPYAHICDSKFYYRRDLSVHLRLIHWCMHPNARPNMSELSVRLASLKAENKIPHDSSTPAQDPSNADPSNITGIFPILTASPSTLIDGIGTAADTSPPLPSTCIRCTRQFTRRTDLDGHVAVRHVASDDRTCRHPNCLLTNKTFTTNSELRTHHAAAHLWPCPEQSCDFQPVDVYAEFLRHMGEVHEGAYSAELSIVPKGSSYEVRVENQGIDDDD